MAKEAETMQDVYYHARLVLCAFNFSEYDCWVYGGIPKELLVAGEVCCYW
jgi:hypothetical protein